MTGNEGTVAGEAHTAHQGKDRDRDTLTAINSRNSTAVCSAATDHCSLACLTSLLDCPCSVHTRSLAHPLTTRVTHVVMVASKSSVAHPTHTHSHTGSLASDWTSVVCLIVPRVTPLSCSFP